MQKMFRIYLVFFSALLGGCQQGPAATSITPGSPSQATALPTYATPTFEAKNLRRVPLQQRIRLHRRSHQSPFLVTRKIAWPLKKKLLLAFYQGMR